MVAGSDEQPQVLAPHWWQSARLAPLAAAGDKNGPHVAGPLATSVRAGGLNIPPLDRVRATMSQVVDRNILEVNIRL
jgi:hypothetical protein